MRDLRGRGHAFPFPGDGAATLGADQEHVMNGTGFRLAHNDTGQVYRGGGWVDGPQFARVAFRRGGYGPGDRNRYLGIRLTADWSGK